MREVVRRICGSNTSRQSVLCARDSAHKTVAITAGRSLASCSRISSVTSGFEKRPLSRKRETGSRAPLPALRSVYSVVASTHEVRKKKKKEKEERPEDDCTAHVSVTQRVLQCGVVVALR